MIHHIHSDTDSGTRQSGTAECGRRRESCRLPKRSLHLTLFALAVPNVLLAPPSPPLPLLSAFSKYPTPNPHAAKKMCHGPMVTSPVLYSTRFVDLVVPEIQRRVIISSSLASPLSFVHIRNVNRCRLRVLCRSIGWSLAYLLNWLPPQFFMLCPLCDRPYR